MPLDKANVFQADLRLVEKAMRSSVTEAYSKRKDKHWQVWHDFCLHYGIDPFLREAADPVPYLQVFANHYRTGRISPSKKPVASSTVSDAVRSVGQAFARVGAADPRLTPAGKIDYRLQAIYRSYRKTDAPPTRVKPLPITIVMDVLDNAFRRAPSAERKAVANMICIAFFFCLRPGEYTGTTTDDQAFALNDVAFFLGGRKLNNATATDSEISSATHLTLTFTTQKNGDKGTELAHSLSGHAWCCPVRSAARQFLHHRDHFRCSHLAYNSSVKLASFYTVRNSRLAIKATHVTSTLRWHAGLLHATTGIDPKHISARSLRARGAMALFTGGCDSNQIKLVARWHSDSMMLYLHQTSLPVHKRLARQMFNNGRYDFLPSEWVPSHDPLPL